MLSAGNINDFNVIGLPLLDGTLAKSAITSSSTKSTVSKAAVANGEKLILLVTVSLISCFPKQ